MSIKKIYINDTCIDISYDNILKCVVSTTVLSSIPSFSFALTGNATLDKLFERGTEIGGILSISIIEVVSIITVIRLINEFMNGSNEHRLFKILKDCLAVIFAMAILPKLPLLITMIFK